MGRDRDTAGDGGSAETAERGMTKTTLYVSRSLHRAIKRAALDEGLSLNAFLLAAIEHRLGSGVSASPGSSGTPVRRPEERSEASLGTQGDLHAALDQLRDRLAAVEQALARGGQSDGPSPAPPRRPLSVAQVRRVVREILLDHGAPLPHRDLVDILLHERKLPLPGRDPSENLRTILVHPKAQGFRFMRRRGYWVDDRPLPPEEPATSD
ncbi:MULTISPECIES: hypothetical protein [Methylobacteriaceae]|jgi:hypothetical protein|nr:MULTISPECIES: hypothetical protein [Methylobacteriaceae]MBY0252469.1 hypothetical protein [Methylobacterium organophilum]MDV2984017.1 hypothetical protein [Methylobacteriaceae bacterium AG10]RUP02562.1 MAG: hypothetical protein EKK34_23540 [Mycobacterium sp.]GJE28770.1 hypothetical protein LKMONMHP_3644 [Methylobacterium organophilum]